MKTIEETYRERLQILIAEHGSQAALARKIDKNPAQISQWLNGAVGASGKPRSLRAETARDIERKTGKPIGWFDQPINITNHNQGYTNYGNHNQGTQTIQGYCPISEQILAATAQTMLMPDDSMAPVIPRGSELWIDNNQEIHDGKTYLLEWGGLALIRRVYRRPNNLLRLAACNAEYGEDTVKAEEVAIKGRVLKWCVSD